MADLTLQSPPRLTLVSYDICPFVQRAAFFMEELGLPYEVRYVDLTAKPEWFLQLSPTGKVPLLLVNDEVLFESQVILEYLSELAQELGMTARSWWPKDVFQRALQRALAEFASAMILTQWRMSIAQTEQEFDAHHLQLKEQIQRLEAQVYPAPFGSGSTFTLFDIAFGPLLQRLQIIQDTQLPGLLPTKLLDWYGAIATRESFQRSYPKNLAAKIQERIDAEGGLWAAAYKQ